MSMACRIYIEVERPWAKARRSGSNICSQLKAPGMRYDELNFHNSFKLARARILKFLSQKAWGLKADLRKILPGSCPTGPNTQSSNSTKLSRYISRSTFQLFSFWPGFIKPDLTFHGFDLFQLKCHISWTHVEMRNFCLFCVDQPILLTVLGRFGIPVRWRRSLFSEKYL